MSKTELASFVDEVFGTSGLPGKPKYPVIFVAPLGTAVPDDGIFSYTTINSLRDLGTVEDRSVILFGHDQEQMLRVLSQNDGLFHVAVQSLFGVPGSDYLPWFDDAAFGLDRIAYGAFVAELRAAKETSEQLAARERSGTDVEASRYTTASGKVRYNQDIDAFDEENQDVDD